MSKDPPAITKEEFEQRYATASDMTVEELHRLGLHAVRCFCEEYYACLGWRMASTDQELAKD